MTPFLINTHLGGGQKNMCLSPPLNSWRMFWITFCHYMWSAFGNRRGASRWVYPCKHTWTGPSCYWSTLPHIMLQGIHWFFVHQKGINASENQSFTSYKKAFEVFCSTVADTCITDRLQIIWMVSWQELFIKTVWEVENLDDSVEIQGFYLKQKPNAHYPSLSFSKSTKRNASDIGFCKEGSSILDDRWTSQSGLEKTESTDCEYDSESEGP